MSFLIGFAVVLVVVVVVLVYNHLVRLQVAVNTAWSNIDVLLKQRHDELPKLIETAKAYMRYEEEVLETLIEARARFEQARGVDEISEADSRVRGAVQGLFAVAEGYPDLKADRSFHHLQTRISDLENGISDRRELYNDTVNAYNTRIRQLPDVILADPLGFGARRFFRARSAERRDFEFSADDLRPRR